MHLIYLGSSLGREMTRRNDLEHRRLLRRFKKKRTMGKPLLSL